MRPETKRLRKEHLPPDSKWSSKWHMHQVTGNTFEAGTIQTPLLKVLDRQ